MPKTLGRCKICGVSRLLNYAGLCKRCSKVEAGAHLKLKALAEAEVRRAEMKAAMLREQRAAEAAAAAAAKAAGEAAEEGEAPAEGE